MSCLASLMLGVTIGHALRVRPNSPSPHKGIQHTLPVCKAKLYEDGTWAPVDHNARGWDLTVNRDGSLVDWPPTQCTLTL